MNVLFLGPLRAAEQSQTRQGDVGEHWASFVYACFTPRITRPMSAHSIQSLRELRSRPAWSSSAGKGKSGTDPNIRSVPDFPRRTGDALFFGDFILGEQKKVTRPRQGTV
jgi:hypothetical protein